MRDLPQVWQDRDRKVKPYIWSHRFIGWGRSLVSLAFLGIFLGGDLHLQLEWLLNSVLMGGLFTLWVVYFATLALTWEVLSFPFSVMSWRVERKFHLSKQNFKAWLWDHVKGLLVGAVLGFVFLAVLFGCVNSSPELWWFWCAVIFIGLSIVLAQLAPVLLIPIFFKLRPMDATPLKERLLALCRKFSVEVKDVYHLGMGDKTEKGNAAFVGLGKTKRIIIGDTLYEKFSEEQVEAVFAHELGHQVHNDIWRLLGFSVVTTFLGFYLGQWALEHYLTDWFATTPDRPSGMLLFLIAVSVLQWPMGVAQAAFSRSRERMADAFAAKTTAMAKPLADALENLTFQNWGLFKPNALMEFLQHSHPAPWRRISKLRQDL